LTFIFLGYANGTPVGYLYAQILRRDETASRYAWNSLSMHHLSVNQAYQGQGMGQALMQAALKVAQDQGISSIALDVWSFNTKARAFFAA
jgi:ribosomal protein S18 acetylase RimI-like enzyme